MSEQPRTREELYEQVRGVGREVFILEQMIRLGFWHARGELPNDPADEIRRESELQQELTRLRQENRKLYNEEALLKELRTKRLAESRKKQQETKERRERERIERAEEWKRKKENEIVFLGANVSGGLNQFESDEERLKQNALPVFSRPEEIAAAMNISIGKLRFLAFDRKTSNVSHYINFKLPKKTGGTRLISAPMPALKQLQHWILDNILNRIAPHEAAHGFRAEHNIVTNARPHIGSDVVVNFDLKDFFPSITYRRVKGIFCTLGYSESVSTVFALICTAHDTQEITLDGQTYFVALNERHLPQGAPTSPALTNILCRRLDKRLAIAAEEFGFLFTRYADDLTFSCSKDSSKNISRLMNRVRSIVSHEGLTMNEEKTRVLRKSRQQEVTGVVVNEKLSIDRKTLKRFRATLFQIEKDGLEGKRWGNSSDLISALQGYANFVFMVDKERGTEFKARVKAIAEKHGWQQPQPKFSTKKESEEKSLDKSSEPKKDEKKWWKLW